MTKYKKILYNSLKKEGDNIKKNKAFSIFEIILSILIFSFLMNIAFVKYREFKELRDINEAKTKITEAFYLVSTTSLKQKTKQELQLDLSAKKIIISNKSLKIQEIQLPKDLIYYHTHISNLKKLKLSFTENGNISKSFSIYIFNRAKKVRYKISFYGFDKSRFLKINNYRKKKNSEITYSNIDEYHKNTNEDREIFYVDWRKE